LEHQTPHGGEALSDWGRLGSLINPLHIRVNIQLGLIEFFYDSLG
jgi:hypothetical protein